MKIYVVSAQYCDETIILGASLDERTAERIVECEKLTNIKPDWVGYEEYNTDNYIPLNMGMYPYEVLFLRDGSSVVKHASMSAFVQNRVGNSCYHGERCLGCEVFALGENQALRLATILKEKYEEQQKES